MDGLSRRSFVPLTVGGWIESTDEIKHLLTLGADKITINTSAFNKKNLVSDAAKRFGSQCIVSSIDAKVVNNIHKVFIDRGRIATDLDAVSWAKQIEAAGAGEIFLTSIDNDGSRRGYDLELMKSVSDAVDIPVIAFGGVWIWDHLVEGIKIGNVDAVAVGNVFILLSIALS